MPPAVLPDLMAVDGPFRSCEVYHREEIFFHGNNHLLYPVNVLMWDRLLRSFLGACQGPLEFARRTQLMNGFALASAVTAMFVLVRGATGSIKIAGWTACALGFSRAFLLHATNAAEPPVGVLLSFLAVAAAATARKTGRVWPTVLAGVLIAAAMATYQAMVLVGPAVLVLCAVRTTGQTGTGVGISRGQVLRVFGLFAGSVAGVAAIYGWAYTRQGIVGVGPLVRRFLSVDGGTAGLSASKAINTPIGLVGNLFYAYPSDYAGIRWMFRNHLTDFWAAWLIVLLSASFVAAVAFTVLVARNWGNLSRSRRSPLLAAVVGLACTLLAPLCWDPTYDKLGLHTNAAIVVLVGLALAFLPDSRSRRAAVRLCVLLVFVEILSNSVWVIPNFGRPTPYLHEARKLRGMLQPEDLLVCGWDHVSVMYGSLYGFGKPRLCLPGAAQERGRFVVDDLREMIRQTESRGGRVYFLGILDLTEAAWQPFFGTRLGVPFHSMDPFRDRCRLVASFHDAGRDLPFQLYQ